MANLKAEWKRQMRDLDESGESSQPVRFASVKDAPKTTLKRCVDHALNHSFERASVMADRIKCDFIPINSG